MSKKNPEQEGPRAADVGPLRHQDHPRPINRRQLLAQGFIGYSATLLMPGLFGFLEARARAACGGTAGPSDMVPFLTFDMAGGAALPANFLVGNQGGPEDLLPTYDRLGWDPRATGALNRDFGLPMAANASKLLEGILATASPAARALLRMGSICHVGQDDTSSNRLSTMTLVQAAGAKGLYLSNGMGMVNSLSGGNSDAALQDVRLKPTFITGIADVIASTKFGGDSMRALSNDQLGGIVEGSLGLTMDQIETLRRQGDGDTLASLAECAYKKSLDLLAGASGVDPRGDAIFQQIYGITTATDQSDPEAVQAAIAMNALRGFSGPGVWTIGGCDYHVGTNVVGDQKDREAGVAIGRAVEAAHQLQKPFFFHLLTDGGCSNEQGTRNWVSDAGDKSMSVIGYYKPGTAPAYRQDGNKARLQIGHYKEGQAVERGTVVGDVPLRAAYAVFANYLNACGKIGRFEELAPGVFTAAELDSVLVFA